MRTACLLFLSATLAPAGELVRLEGHRDAVHCVAFAPDGKTLASASVDKTIKLWDVATGKERDSLIGHSDRALSVAFTPNGKSLASGGADNTIRFWDQATGRQTRLLQGHEKQILTVAFSPDGQHLISASADRTVKLWDTSDGTELASFPNAGCVLGGRAAAFSPDGKLFAFRENPERNKGFISVCRTDTRKPSSALPDGLYALALAFAPDGDTLIAASGNKVLTWDLGTDRLTASFEGRWLTLHGLALRPDGKMLATKSTLKQSGMLVHEVKLFALPGGKELATVDQDRTQYPAFGLAFSPDGRRLATARANGTILLYDVAQFTGRTP